MPGTNKRYGTAQHDEGTFGGEYINNPTQTSKQLIKKISQDFLSYLELFVINNNAETTKPKNDKIKSMEPFNIKLIAL